jgi:ligand-binding sensor domain-containing protein
MHISQYGHTVWRLGENGLDSQPRSITQSADGYIWVGTADGLSRLDIGVGPDTGSFRFDGMRLTAWAPVSGESLTNTAVIYVLSARNGSLYVSTQGGVARITNGRVYNYPEKLRSSAAFLEDGQGIV